VRDKVKRRLCRGHETRVPRAVVEKQRRRCLPVPIISMQATHQLLQRFSAPGLWARVLAVVGTSARSSVHYRCAVS
jgi:hypothetical protein